MNGYRLLERFCLGIFSSSDFANPIHFYMAGIDPTILPLRHALGKTLPFRVLSVGWSTKDRLTVAVRQGISPRFPQTLSFGDCFRKNT